MRSSTDISPDRPGGLELLPNRPGFSIEVAAMIDRTRPHLRYELIEVTPAGADPVSLSDAKLHIRVTSTDEDALVTRLISAARRTVEDMTGRELITSTWKALYDGFPSGDAPIELPASPVSSLTSVKYNDADGTEQTLAASVYLSRLDIDPAVVWLDDGQDWPTTYGRGLDVNVEFVAGYGAAGSDVPEPLIQAILLLVGTWYENRETVIVGQTPSVIPDTIDLLLAPYRVRRIA